MKNWNSGKNCHFFNKIEHVQNWAIQILIKNSNLVKNSNFGKKFKFGPKIQFWSKIQILPKKFKFGQKSKFCQKIQIWSKIKKLTKKLLYRPLAANKFKVKANFKNNYFKGNEIKCKTLDQLFLFLIPIFSHIFVFLFNKIIIFKMNICLPRAAHLTFIIYI